MHFGYRLKSSSQSLRAHNSLTKAISISMNISSHYLPSHSDEKSFFFLASYLFKLQYNKCSPQPTVHSWGWTEQNAFYSFSTFIYQMDYYYDGGQHEWEINENQSGCGWKNLISNSTLSENHQRFNRFVSYEPIPPIWNKKRKVSNCLGS